MVVVVYVELEVGRMDFTVSFGCSIAWLLGPNF